MRTRKMAIISIDLDGKNQFLAKSKQIPFVTAKSLTEIAKKSQDEVRKHIREEFHIRKKKGGFESSIRIKPATKRNLESQVYSMAAFAALQQTGGKKKARDGRLAIPIYENIRDVKRKTTKNSPSGYLSGDAFKIKMPSGQEAIAQRKRGSLKLLYFLRKEADIDKRFNMIEVTEKTVRDEFGMIFKKNLQDITGK